MRGIRGEPGRAYAEPVSRLTESFGVDERWARPPPPGVRPDALLAVVWFGLTALIQEMLRSQGALEDLTVPLVVQYLALASGCALLVWRRTHPTVVAALSALHMLVVGVTMPVVMASLPLQVLYFFILYSAVAWARDRQLLLVVVAGVLGVMVLWLAWQFALGSAIADIREFLGEDADEQTGLVSPVVGAVVNTLVVNVLYFGGAILVGQVSWRGALRGAEAAEQARTIRRQSAQLRDQAVVAERLRIARELHDVVAHHVAVMGVQAAAARRVLTRDPVAAEQALSAIESASRSGVGQMRELLGALRSGELAADSEPADGHADGRPRGGRAGVVDARGPQPTLDDLAPLVQSARTPLCDVRLTVVEDERRRVSGVPSPIQVSAYRVVQEALANVQRHSTARAVHVCVRAQAAHLEVEVVDDGRPRTGTSGTGLGLRGMRERAQLVGGEAEIGPRVGQGWRVRVLFPLSTGPTADQALDPAAGRSDEASVGAER